MKECSCKTIQELLRRHGKGKLLMNSFVEEVRNLTGVSWEKSNRKIARQVLTNITTSKLSKVDKERQETFYAQMVLQHRGLLRKHTKRPSELVIGESMRLNNKCVRLFTDKHLENMGSMFKTLYNDELLTDCTLYCKDGYLRAHKVILAASSPYFRKVFLDNKDDRTVFIMHGISLDQLRDLLELIYKGSLDLPGETVNSVYGLAEELQLTGVLFEDSSTDTGSRSNGYGRDTRYKGQKRVAVDFTRDDSDVMPEKIVTSSTERRSSSCSDKGSAATKNAEPSNQVDNNSSTPPESEPSKDVGRLEVSNKDRLLGHPVDGQSNLSVWARKERKFKCDLCPSSFKRASHLTRHQLVHTGERPFACNQCDKAFSRHDKLKHHIHKAHELPALNEALPPDSLYTIDHVRILTPEQTMTESSEPVVRSRSNSPAVAPPQKKGRGRPRKHPPVPPPLVKRPRGRPRLNPVVSTVSQETEKQANYDISNMPYGDIDYLTKPLDDSEEISIEEHSLMEPLVEIKTELNARSKPEKLEKTGQTFLENIGLFENSQVAKIGECTISVASNNSTS